MGTVEFSGYRYRSLARLIVEAVTPISIGSGEKNILSDSSIAYDINGLPYIPGTSISGAVRSMFSKEDRDDIFGSINSDGHASEIRFTEGRILDSNSNVMDGLCTEAEKDSLLSYYTGLPIRQHVRLNDKGTSENGGLFNEEVVYAGTRFCFELELISKDDNEKAFDQILSIVFNKGFRLGGGSRKGFGQLNVVSCKRAHLDLATDMDKYLSKSSSLQESAAWDSWTDFNLACESDGFDVYKLELRPVSFIHFGSGLPDAVRDADMSPIREKKVKWSSNKGEMSSDLLLVPATSVKGALRHRMAYHMRKINKIFVDSEHAADEPKEVTDLFGMVGETPSKGKLIISDVFLAPYTDSALKLPHVRIDRITGGTVAGALFQEVVNDVRDMELQLEVIVPNDALAKESKDEKALLETLKDVCKGLLPLGGGVNRGNGMFNGRLIKNGEVIYE